MAQKNHQPIYPCIWCKNNNAPEMAGFYVSVFPDTKITDEDRYVDIITIGGQRIMLLNGNEESFPNPSISLMYLTTSEKEVEDLYAKLTQEGSTLMPLDSYPFSPKYAWVEDRYGVSWQLIAAEAKDIIQKVVPTMMFVGDNNGKAEEAMSFYTSLFPESGIRGISRYTGEEGETAGNIQHAEFALNGYLLMSMDSSYPHAFNFNEGVSLVVECDTQEEIDHYWDGLTADGGQEVMCGWLTDKYGVSWQITPREFEELILKSPKVFEAMLKIKKMDIRKLREAAESPE
ncbi:VOC family protein [uncultured Proteiniphilum sp.]|uniref:VOC family protein n=1 Tax=uncultured Proteiniphilum sp. TaxID=497637 RepID=UPI00263905C6|nr:VOC family protein [uncultured Proteiniphilum sp.]